MPNFKIRYLLIALIPLAVAGCVSSEDQRRTMQSLESQDRKDQKRAEMNWQEGQDMLYRRQDSSIDTTPQYDKDGNPNFDAQGNYIGCHGIGCKVDNPDDADN